MLDVLLEEDIITVCIVIFFGISIVMQGLLSIFYQNMIDEAENMATTEHKMLKQCKLKFSNCYQLNGGVANIPVFVDKFLGKLAFGRISFEAMYHISGQAMLLSVVSAGVGICKSIVRNRSIVEILPFYIVCFLELYLYFSITSMLDVKGRKQRLKINLVDYLENHLSSRMETTAGDIRMLYGEDFRELKGKKEPGRGKRRTLVYTPITSARIEGEEGVDKEKNDTEKADLEKADKEKSKTEKIGVEKREIESGSAEKSTIEEKNERTVAGDKELQDNIANIFTKAQEKELENLLKEFLTS